jgi:signal peptidase II
VKRSLILLVAVAGSVLALDMWTKRWASETLAYRPPVEILGEFVRLTYTRNSGVAFGLGAGHRFPYYLFSIFAALVIVYLFLRQRVPSPRRQVALSLILGGALGNLVDRVSSGEVVDFIEIGWSRWHWPVFNVADSAVTIGVVMFALAWSAHSEGQPQAAEGEIGPKSPAAAKEVDEPEPGSLGSSAERRGAARSLPGGGADEPVA